MTNDRVLRMFSFSARLSFCVVHFWRFGLHTEKTPNEIAERYQPKSFSASYLPSRMGRALARIFGPRPLC